MQQESLDFFFKSFAEEQMNFLYTGDFTDELTDYLIELNNLQFSSNDELKSSQRKSGFLIAECFQNIVRHSDLSNQYSYFHIQNNEGLFNLISGNTIKNDAIPILQSQLEQLNKLTSEELREMYRKILAEGNFSNKGGAGLGLIEMARKTKNKLSFAFSEIDAIKSYFYFQLKLNTTESDKKNVSCDFDNSITLRNRMLEDDIFLLYNGVVSTKATIAILGVIEKTLKSVNQKVVFTRFMGFFERISVLELPMNRKNTTTLSIGENDQEYNIGASCFLKKEEASSIQRALKFYRFLNKEVLENEYNNIIKSGNQNNKSKFNLDLIEILRNSSKLDVDVRSYTNEVSFISLIIKFDQKNKNSSSLKKRTDAKKLNTLIGR